MCAGRGGAHREWGRERERQGQVTPEALAAGLGTSGGVLGGGKGVVEEVVRHGRGDEFMRQHLFFQLYKYV